MDDASITLWNKKTNWFSLCGEKRVSAEIWAFPAAVAGGGEHDWSFDVEYFRKETMEE